MEISNEGRVTIIEDGENFEVIIPSPKNWFLIISFGIGFLMILPIITDSFLLLSKNFLSGIFFLFFFSLVALLLFGILLWLILGKEKIIFENEILTIEKSNAIFIPTKTYDLGLIKEFWVEREILFPFYVEIMGFFVNLNFSRLIRFKYNNKQVKFGVSLNEREANYIVSFLKEKNILKNN